MQYTVGRTVTDALSEFLLPWRKEAQTRRVARVTFTNDEAITNRAGMGALGAPTSEEHRTGRPYGLACLRSDDRLARHERVILPPVAGALHPGGTAAALPQSHYGLRPTRGSRWQFAMGRPTGGRQTLESPSSEKITPPHGDHLGEDWGGRGMDHNNIRGAPAGTLWVLSPRSHWREAWKLSCSSGRPVSMREQPCCRNIRHGAHASSRVAAGTVEAAAPDRVSMMPD